MGCAFQPLNHTPPLDLRPGVYQETTKDIASDIHPLGSYKSRSRWTESVIETLGTIRESSLIAVTATNY